MVCGILAIVFCGIFTAIPAIIMGNKARRQIQWSEGRLGGDGMALAGVILGWIAVAFTVLGVIIVLIVIATADPDDFQDTLRALGS